MLRSQEIRPVLEEGIDRKVMMQLRERFLEVNRGRLARCLEAMSSRQQRVLRLLPLLFHVNHPLFPGYVSAATPAGLHGFEPEAELLAEAQTLCRSFAYKENRTRSGRNIGPSRIHGLFLMGSLGSLAHAENSDLDVWVCHDSGLSPASLCELERKCELISAWAAEQGTEAHFFVIDPARFGRGEDDVPLSAEHCGSSQHYLLLDEFYRSAIWLGGRVLTWWLVPPYEEHRYEDYVRILLERRFIRAEELLDLGHLGRIPPAEFLGAGLWQLYKGIASPYKALLKLLLTEVYASQHPRVDCLGLRFKQAVYQNRLELDALDPYLQVYRLIEEYLRGRAEPERLELVRRALYFKVDKPLSRPPSGAQKSWQRVLFEQLAGEWGWDEAQLVRLDRRSGWKVAEVSRERRALVSELTYSFRFLSQFARQQQVASSLGRRDLAIIGRKLYAAFERKPGKVELVNPGISPDMAEEALTLVCHTEAGGERLWSLYRGSLSLRQCEDFAPLKRGREPVALLAWCHRNGLIDSGTRLSLHPGDSALSEGEVAGLLGSLRQVLPLPLPRVPDEAWLLPATPQRILLLANAGLDPAELPGADSLTENPAAAENRVSTLDQVTLNSWNELLVLRYEGAQALADCLLDYLRDERPAPVLRAACHCRHRDPRVPRRLEALFGALREQLQSQPGSRYLINLGGRFQLFDLTPGQLGQHELADRQALVEHLGQLRHVWSPLRLDDQALPAGDELRLILTQGKPGRLQLFYRVEDEEAELTVLDERNTLWRQRQAFRDVQTLLTPLWRFLQAVLFRRAAHLPLQRGAELEISLHELVASGSGGALRLESRQPPRSGPEDAFYEVQAIIEPGDGDRSQVTLYCNGREFSSLEYGDALYSEVARDILGRRRHAERYPCYLTDLSAGEAPHTVQSLRHKVRLEVALNQALARLY
ncbi:class I adenylate cyclase [Stutzerimonas tarimensis]|uniref:Class I adenylate cyclase n=1 Tax=Stutzerimonas tarimensis TaxID=1507735 RepID=A0ABV7T6E9_9GAMM